ncbi:arsenosugar biosynthesis radical SAM protein ArsS [Salinisphaera sp. P385]|uniref:Arsenosugar biosynthesis radical SAM protein ArsS n=1 Tax=Spectribacter acetivorans TaxID=3075603 RepID=A0ABU3BBK8_9GAMM|nr:arsenosugar biosynthesis radical SAM (seleno)protein ArsS [Salinisphaera sp. P385]MDT0619649.1 arsenosugar biosynthesis radical SAM protein ArsS [Salinisphaera sp. P385]
MRDTQPLFQQTDFPPLRRARLETLQMNLGYLCNLACTHCHVAAGPRRTELMDRETMDVALDFIQRQSIANLDVTGGSPEMNPHFEYLMREAAALGTHLMDRCNPTIIEEPGYEWVPDLLAELRVEVVASLPCYTSDNVDKQRGKGVFDASIKALQKLNDRGYGHPDSGLTLNLVYNPAGPTLPPPQEQLQADYKQFLTDEFGIVFNDLFTLANMPIKRFGSILLSKGQFGDYMALLQESHRAENARNVMCRSLVSVDYRGYVYDCDFNQMLDVPLGATNRPRTHLRDLLDTDFNGQSIAVADHCYGCTAGQGSSCGGALN